MKNEKLITTSEELEAIRYQHDKNIADGWFAVSGIITVKQDNKITYLIKYTK
jgi:hypothetical protein